MKEEQNKQKKGIEDKKEVRIQVKKKLLNKLEREAKKFGMSKNDYINHVLISKIAEEKLAFVETTNKPEKKEIESRIYFTKNEAELLKSYAKNNEWSLSKEVRYRVIASMALTPKLSGEELKTIYSIRSSINVLGANINRLVRDSIPIRDDNIEICQDLVKLISELKNKISYLEKCNHSSFKLKETIS